MSCLKKNLVALVLLGAFLGGPVLSAVPAFIPYQGYLTDSSGVPVDGVVELTFALYDQSGGGTLLWQETHAAVPVVAGFFQVNLGDQTPLGDELFEPPLYLGISVDGDAEMTPRMRVGSVPFSRISAPVLACAVGESVCDGECVDLNSDPAHCSACNLVCAGGELCEQGSCCQAQTWYLDQDGDGYGDCADSILSCGPTGGHTTTICGDCDDTDPTVYPGAPEICDDGKDNNCNGMTDCDDPLCDLDPACPA